VATVVLLIAILAVLLTMVPVPFHTRAEGVVWLPEQALVRAGANGFLSSFLVEPGTWVTKSSGLIQSADPTLKAQVRESEAYVAELEASYAAAAVSNRVQAEVASQKLEQERAHLAELQSLSADLIARANADGIFMVPQQGDLPGRFFRKGDLLGYVLGTARPIVRVVVPQDAIDKVRLDLDDVHVRLVDEPGMTYQGHIVREVPAGEEYLPSLALAAEGGGEVATDPRDTKAPKSLQRMFQLDVELVGDVQFHQFGQRVFVRFEHQRVPLAVQWFRTIRLLFLSRFSV
jgi:putative peptide zinc metalloprotease protein